MTTTKIPANKIPVAPLVRAIDEYAQDTDDRATATCRVALLNRAGIDQGMYGRWKAGEYHATSFDIADRLMTAMGKSHLWYIDSELHSHYMAVDLTCADDVARREWDRLAALRATGPEHLKRHLVCGHCKQRFSVYVHSGQSPVCCSHECNREYRREYSRLRAQRRRMEAKQLKVAA